MKTLANPLGSAPHLLALAVAVVDPRFRVVGTGFAIRSCYLGKMWDMFCGWGGYEAACNSLARGKRQVSMNWRPPPGVSSIPTDISHATTTTPTTQTVLSLAKNCLDHTVHEPMGRSCRAKRSIRKKFNMADDQYEAYYGKPKDRPQLLPHPVHPDSAGGRGDASSRPGSRTSTRWGSEQSAVDGRHCHNRPFLPAGPKFIRMEPTPQDAFMSPRPGLSVVSASGMKPMIPYLEAVRRGLPRPPRSRRMTTLELAVPRKGGGHGPVTFLQPGGSLRAGPHANRVANRPVVRNGSALAICRELFSTDGRSDLAVDRLRHPSLIPDPTGGSRRRGPFCALARPGDVLPGVVHAPFTHSGHGRLHLPQHARLIGTMNKYSVIAAHLMFCYVFRTAEPDVVDRQLVGGRSRLRRQGVPPEPGRQATAILGVDSTVAATLHRNRFTSSGLHQAADSRVFHRGANSNLDDHRI